MGMTLEEIIASIKEAGQNALKPIVCALTERYGIEPIGMQFALAGGGEEAGNPFAQGLIQASEMPPANPPTPLYYGMYPGRVTLMIGETGAGKSSLLYNIAVHAALGETLYGFRFLMPVKVLYIDPENSGNYRDGGMDGGLCGAKLARIGKGCPPNLTFHDGRGLDLSKPSHMENLKELIRAGGFGLVILDPIANLFNTKDENSNGEAAQHGKALTALSRETGACIVAVHHTGKQEGGNYGRGASARLGAADVGVVFRARGESGDLDDTYTSNTRQRNDICRFQIVKDRLNVFGHCSKYLKMAGEDRFELATFESWKGSGQSERVDKTSQAEEEITLLMQDGVERSRALILEQMKAEDIGLKATDTALSKLSDKQSGSPVLTLRRGDRNAAFYTIAREEGTI